MIDFSFHWQEISLMLLWIVIWGKMMQFSGTLYGRGERWEGWTLLTAFWLFAWIGYVAFRVLSQNGIM